MYSVLIVDDEPWALEGIANSIEWEQLGFKVRWKLTNSVEAMKVIEKEKPDVVVSDIRMPEITGIEMLSQTREKNINSEFVLISGYADFEYAQKAITYGAFHYILKPIKRTIVKEVFEKLYKSLASKEVEDQQDYMVYKQLVDIGRVDINMLSELGLKIDYPYYQVAIIENNSYLDLKELDKNKEISYIIMKISLNKQLLIINCSNSVSGILKNILDGKDEQEINIGVSDLHADISFIGELLKEANISLLSHFIYGVNSVYVLPNREYKIVRRLIATILEAFISRSEERLEKAFTDTIETFKEKNLGIIDIEYLYNDLISYFNHNFPRNKNIEELGFMNYELINKEFISLDNMCNYIKKTMYTLILENSKGEDIVNENFQNLLDFIKMNYMNEIYLNDLSKQFHLSSSYICELFKKVTNMTLSKYIMELRLKQACELLTVTNLTVQEVADQVGYKDYFYFNKIFKREFKMTPTVYRKNLL